MASMILISWLLAGPATPPVPAASALGRPAPALQELAPLLGTWRCRGTQRLTPASKLSPTAGGWVFARDLDGFWISVQQEQDRTDANPRPAKARGHLGYNADQQRFVLFLAGNDGLAEQQGSPGWDGPRLVFSGQLRDGDDLVNFRRAFELRGGGLQVALELELKEKEWTQVAAETCQR